MTPLRFMPIYKQMLWGGTGISRYKGIAIPGTDIGESWELSGVAGSLSVLADSETENPKNIEELISLHGDELLGAGITQKYGGKFPLLIKLIDAGRDLSLQVHPDDGLAQELHGCYGKTEAWFVISSKGEALIHCGLACALTPEIYDSMISDSRIMTAVKSHLSRPGAFYYVPSGTLHAIGSGNLIAEIQQTSDITYRVYDYNRLDAQGRPRQLHTSEARRAIDYTYPSRNYPNGECFTRTTEGAVISPYFRIDYLKLSEENGYQTCHGGDSFRILMVTEGDVRLETSRSESDTTIRTECRQGETLLIPACLHNIRIYGNATALLIHL